MTSQAKHAAHLSWGRTRDRAARTEPARSGLDAKFTREAREQLGPGASERDVALAAESLRRAHYQRLSAAGVAARKAG